MPPAVCIGDPNEICLVFEFGYASLSAAVTCFLISLRLLSLPLLNKKTAPLVVKTTGATVVFILVLVPRSNLVRKFGPIKKLPVAGEFFYW